MPSPVFQPLIEVFLLVEQPRQRLSHWSQALAPLDGAEAPPVATVDAYYNPISEQAILGLRYDELALGPERLSFLVEVALRAEIGMIQPAELPESDRGRFVSERLATCTVHVGDQRKIVSALAELVRRVGDQAQQAIASLPAMEVIPEVPLPAPLVMASGRAHDDAVAAMPPVADPLHGSVRRPKQDSVGPAGDADATDVEDVEDVEDVDDLTDVNSAGGATAVPEPLQHQVKTAPITPPTRRVAAAPAPRRPERLRPSLNVLSRAGVHRAPTVTMSPTETQRMIEAAIPETEREILTQPYLAAAWDPSKPGMIHARYLRRGRWMPIRIGTLSLKGATLMAGALPRIDDRVEVALAYAKYRVLVPGVVGKISTMQEAATSGAATFSVRFEPDEESRRELRALLTAARAAKVTLKPPPMRSTRRYPVAWPINLGTARGVVRAEALDVSIGGMFARPVHALALALDENVTFSVVLDDGLSPVSGRSRVIRNISDAEARATELSPGYGLSIVEMSGEDRERWVAFLTRIEQRSAKRVLIGAAPARLAELENGLVAAGYAVTGGSEPGALAQLASAGAHPVDGALIDASWLAAASSSRVESLFSARKVPCVTVHGDVQRARIAVDRLLAVV